MVRDSTAPATIQKNQPYFVLLAAKKRVFSFVDSLISTMVAQQEDDKNDQGVVLKPTEQDVLLGRGAGCWNHAGNQAFRELVGGYLKAYNDAILRIEKSNIVSEILKKVQERGGRFLKKDPTKKEAKWYVVEKRQAIEKIGHAIRDKMALEFRKETLLNITKEHLRQADSTHVPTTTTLKHRHHGHFASDSQASHERNVYDARVSPPHLPRHRKLRVQAVRRSGSEPVFGPFHGARITPPPPTPTMHPHHHNNSRSMMHRPPSSPLAIVRGPPQHQGSRPTFFTKTTHNNSEDDRSMMEQLSRRCNVLHEQATNHLKAASHSLHALQKTRNAMQCLSGSSSATTTTATTTTGITTEKTASLMTLASMSTLLERLETISATTNTGSNVPSSAGSRFYY